MLISIAWRNVWRNKLRSLVVIIAIVLGVFAGAFSYAFYWGWSDQRMDNMLETQISHIQIHLPEYRDDPKMRLFIPDAPEKVREIQQMPEVLAAAARLETNGIITGSRSNAGVEIIGIYPNDEANLTKLNERIVLGRYLDEGSSNRILLGLKLARKLKVLYYNIDDKVIDSLRRAEMPEEWATRLTDLKGERFRDDADLIEAATKLVPALADETTWADRIANFSASINRRARLVIKFSGLQNDVEAAFRIQGVYRSQNTMLEETMIYMRAEKFTELVGQQVEAHEIAILATDLEAVPSLQEKLAKAYPDLEVADWKTISPDLRLMVESFDNYMVIFLVIIMLGLAFSIINTMLMAVLERTRELGMLQAIGMRRNRIFGMVMIETVFLAVVGGPLGLFVAWLVTFITSQTGINLAMISQGLEAYGYNPIVFPELKSSIYLQVSIWVMITALLSAIYPAYKALKLKPVEAIRAL